MSEVRTVRLFRNGAEQAISIPVEFELPGETALIHKEGSKLIIETAAPKRGLLAWLRTLEPIEEDFPDFDESLLPARDVDL